MRYMRLNNSTTAAVYKMTTTNLDEPEAKLTHDNRNRQNSDSLNFKNCLKEAVAICTFIGHQAEAYRANASPDFYTVLLK